MYTKCPECQIAFRVTAHVLRQAAGNVRCGGCGHAFSAIEFLTEDMPATDAETPGDASDDSLAETSRRLLETLEQRGALGEAAAAQVARQVLAALAAAPKQRIDEIRAALDALFPPPSGPESLAIL